MKLKRLKSLLQYLDSFESPNIALEQYATLADTAADMLDVVKKAGDIDNKMIADLGCGCGVLGIGAAMFGAGFCVGFEIDEQALDIAKANQDSVDCTNIDFVQCDVTSLEGSRWYKAFDTVVMNPPFGTKDNKGLDIRFLKTAVSLAKHSIYSLHKASTVRHIGVVAEALNVSMQPCYEIAFEVPQTYKRHHHETADIKVNLLSFSVL